MARPANDVGPFASVRRDGSGPDAVEDTGGGDNSLVKRRTGGALVVLALIGAGAIPNVVLREATMWLAGLAAAWLAFGPAPQPMTVASVGLGRRIVRVAVLLASMVVVTFAFSAAWQGHATPMAIGTSLGSYVIYLRAGVVEELVFRWVVPFCGGLRPIGGAMLSTAVFAMLHAGGGIRAVVLTALIGSVLMLFVMRTKDLPAAMAAHFAFDVLLAA